MRRRSRLLLFPLIVAGKIVHRDASLESACSETSAPPLRPTDLPPPTVFQSFSENKTLPLPDGSSRRVLLGTATSPDQLHSAEFAVVPEAVNRSSVEAVLALVRNYRDWDDDPDTVDGMPTDELFLHSPHLYAQDARSTPKHRDVDPDYLPARNELRRTLGEILRPYLDDVLTPLVRSQFPEACARADSRRCAPCYGLLRRYARGRRRSHAAHYDGHAVATAVVSLSDYGAEYRGGLYVGAGAGQREFLALRRGDAVLHRSNLLHGVRVHELEEDPAETVRWSWILWYRDSAECRDFGYEWFAECAEEGDALCQSLHATKVGSRPGVTEEQAAKEVLEWNLRAADGGSGFSAVKIARAYMGQLPSTLPYDVERAEKYYRVAIDAHNPEGHYGMALLLLMQVEKEYNRPENSEVRKRSAWKDPRVQDAIRHLESASMQHHAFSMFNLGIVHTFGYHRTNDDQGNIDSELAGQWFEACGLPEGYFVAAHQAKSVGNKEREREMTEEARATGYFEPWRKMARQKVGSGGSGGVDLNLPWPPAFDGRLPPKF